MYRQQFWSLRQNPYANTNQRQMRELIISQKTTFTIAPGLLSAQGGRHLKSGSIISYQMECKQNQRDNF